MRLVAAGWETRAFTHSRLSLTMMGNGPEGRQGV